VPKAVGARETTARILALAKTLPIKPCVWLNLDYLTTVAESAETLQAFHAVGNKKKALAGDPAGLCFTGGQGQNRTADTGIFRPRYA